MSLIYMTITFLLSFSLAGILYGISIFGLKSVKNKKYKDISPFIMPIISIIPTIIVLEVVGINIFNLASFNNITYWIILLITVLIVTILVISKKSSKRLSTREILLDGLSGLSMEIPQRLLMQTLIYGMLRVWRVSDPEIYSCLINAIVWCSGIMVQALIMNKTMNKELYLDISSSFIFSIGIGYIFISSQCILYAMIAHFMERVLSKTIQNHRILAKD